MRRSTTLCVLAGALLAACAVNPAFDADDRLRIGELVDVSGEVSHLCDDGVTPASDNVVRDGDTVATGADGSARVSVWTEVEMLAEGDTVLDPGTTVVFSTETNSPRRPHVRVSRGRAFVAWLKGWLGIGTPDIGGGTHGTAFSVAYDPAAEASTLTVLDGEVGCAALDGPVREATVVGQAQTMSARRGAAVTVERATVSEVSGALTALLRTPNRAVSTGALAPLAPFTEQPIGDAQTIELAAQALVAPAQVDKADAERAADVLASAGVVKAADQWYARAAFSHVGPDGPPAPLSPGAKALSAINLKRARIAYLTDSRDERGESMTQTYLDQSVRWDERNPAASAAKSVVYAQAGDREKAQRWLNRSAADGLDPGLRQAVQGRIELGPGRRPELRRSVSDGR